MKKFIVLLGLLAFAGGVCSAQTKGYTLGSWFQGESISLNGHKEFKSVGLVVAPGYAFNSSIFVRLQYDLVVGMWNRGGDSKTYRTNSTLGPSVGWNIVKNNREWGIVDLVATVGNTLENKDWSYIYYDLGASWTMRGSDRTGLSLGFGVRYNDSHNSRYGNYCTLYVRWGFRFN